MLSGAWTRARLGDVCDLNPRRPELPRPDTEATSFVPMAAVAESGRGILRIEERPYAEVRRGYTFFAEGDILFAKITPCMQNGKHAIARGLRGGSGFASTEFHVLRPKPEAVVAEWVHYFLLQPDVLLGAEASFSGAVGQQRVSPTYLADLLIPVPPLEEQRRIAARLTVQLAAVERARHAAQAKLHAAEHLFAAEVSRVFSGVSAWPQLALRDICLADGQYGLSLPGNTLQGDGVPILRMGNIRDGHVGWDSLQYVEVDRTLFDKYRVTDGDVLLNRTNSAELVGKTAVFHGKRNAVFASYLVRFRIDPRRAVPDFVAAYINSPGGREFIRARMTRAIGQVNISASTMHRMPIPVPPLGEQNRVVVSMQRAEAYMEAVAIAAMAEFTAIDALPAVLLRQTFGTASAFPRAREAT